MQPPFSTLRATLYYCTTVFAVGCSPAGDATTTEAGTFVDTTNHETTAGTTGTGSVGSDTLDTAMSTTEEGSSDSRGSSGRTSEDSDSTGNPGTSDGSGSTSGSGTSDGPDPGANTMSLCDGDDVTPVNAYYVSPSSGDDTNAGTSASSPWKTLDQANRILQAGDAVYLMSGTYSGPLQTISPEHSGTPGARIVYAAERGASVTFANTNYFITLDGNEYVTIQGPMVFESPTSAWGYLADSHHIDVVGNTFIGNGRLQYSGMLVNARSSYNAFCENTFQDWGENPTKDKAGSYGDALRFTDEANHNLIENNNFYEAGHAGLSLDASDNVVRSNLFTNSWYRGMVLTWVDNPSWLDGTTDLPCEFNVIEGNRFDSNHTQGIQLATPNNIVRRNVFVGDGNDGIDMEGWGAPQTTDAAPYVSGNRIYHNTFIANGAAAGGPRPGGIFLTNWGIATVDMTNTRLKNNIFTRNDGSNNQLTIDLGSGGGPGDYSPNYYNTNYRIAGSCFSGAPNINVTSLDGAQSIDYYQAKYPMVFYGNDSSIPSFVDEPGRDFHLEAGSGCIDRGVALTTTTSAGSGTEVPLGDVLYFSDGKGLVEGDAIVIGSDQVKVIAVNYFAKVITIDRAISWTLDADVNFPYSGAAPDAGAYEHVR